MSQNLYLVTAGGTGMRCLQSFINTCALGMYPGKTINILLLETDEENKDKKNTENLIQYYNKIRGKKSTNFNNDDEKAKIGNFYSANINLYTFVPDYSTEQTRNFVVLSQVERGDSEENRMLANIFYEEGVQEFNLAHGYRAQTHLGSYLMYHAFVDEIRKATANDDYQKSSQLFKFINKIKESNQDGAKIFALGSSFGGTGASSIPVITRAITDSCKIITGDKIEMDRLYYGGVVLSSYFKFSPPSDAHKKKDKIIADSQFFEHNSAAALMYYVNDPTILDTYKRLYLLGWGDFKLTNVDDFKQKVASGGKADTKTVTGGKKQQNPAHILELFGAFAAKHFFDETTPISELNDISSTEFKFKSLEATPAGDGAFLPTVRFEDLYSIPDDENKKGGQLATHEKIRDNFVAFYSIGSILRNYYDRDVVGLIKDLRRYNCNFNEYSDDQIEGLNRFFEYFTSIPQESSSDQQDFYPGWFNQLYMTFHGGDDPKDEYFFGLSAESLGLKNSKWWMNYNEFAGLSEVAVKDKFIQQFKKINRKNKSGNLAQLVEALRKTFYSLTTYDAIASENNAKEENK